MGYKIYIQTKLLFDKAIRTYYLWFIKRSLSDFMVYMEIKGERKCQNLFARNQKRCTMTFKEEKGAFVWIWLPSETEPVVAGRLEADNGNQY